MLFVDGDFLFGFLPVAVAGFWLALRTSSLRAALAWLVLASFVFYAWWKPPFLLLLLASIGGNFFLGRRIAEAEARGRARALLALGVVFNLALIAYFKYANFFLDNVGALVGRSWQIDDLILPIGISFYTFQQIAYLADCFADRRCETSVERYALFVSFFPQLIAGPIVHHKQVLPQFASGELAEVARARRIEAINLFVLALAKKLLLADTLSQYATPVFGLADTGVVLTAPEAWLGILAYSFQIYFDFSAYSEMAMAMALFLGIQLPVNFASPYKASSITEFWRCWHMTLSTFLRDYLYIPLGGNRRGVLIRYRNLFVTMLLGGLWHGASWNFVIWGGLHGLFLSVHHLWRTLGISLPAPLGRLLTFLSVSLAWCFFRATTFEGARSIAASALGLQRPETAQPGIFPHLGPSADAAATPGLAMTLRELLSPPWVGVLDPPILGSACVVVAAAIAFFGIPNLEWSRRPAARSIVGAVALAALLFAMALRSLQADPGEFIYFQF